MKLHNVAIYPPDTVASCDSYSSLSIDNDPHPSNSGSRIKINEGDTYTISFPNISDSAPGGSPCDLVWTFGYGGGSVIDGNPTSPTFDTGASQLILLNGVTSGHSGESEIILTITDSVDSNVSASYSVFV